MLMGNSGYTKWFLLSSSAACDSWLRSFNGHDEIVSEQDRAAFMNLPKHLQDRPDKDIPPRVVPDEQERQTHTKRFATPGKYKVA